MSFNLYSKVNLNSYLCNAYFLVYYFLDAKMKNSSAFWVWGCFSDHSQHIRAKASTIFASCSFFLKRLIIFHFSKNMRSFSKCDSFLGGTFIFKMWKKTASKIEQSRGAVISCCVFNIPYVRMVSIKERFLIKSGLWWRAYVMYFHWW